MNKEDYTILYLCKGEGKHCGCLWPGQCREEGFPTECRHTSHEEEAEFEPCEEPWRHPDRFKCVVLDNGKMLFWEKFPAERLYHYCDGNLEVKW